MEISVVDGRCFSKMVKYGANGLKTHVKEVNDLNVFPIPDGDTGDNMLLTMLGGANVSVDQYADLGSVARNIANGMLLSARGNSGVILSQFFDGIASGLSGVSEADVILLGNAFSNGVKKAYSAVIEPTEGTILTVAREATEVARTSDGILPEDFLKAFIKEARQSLERTPDLLEVLKKAGVVDSGGAGLIYIVEGMLEALGVDVEEDLSLHSDAQEQKEQLNLDLFDENSELEFGYCTELLLRLQNSKCNIDGFNVEVISDYLGTIGDSIVAVKSGSIVKIHVHTKTPYMVLQFCQQFGEYLTVKVENMSLQHNNLPHGVAPADNTERSDYAVVAVASGEGIKRTFREMGADYIVDGGQSMNPSADDFIEAFDKVNADTVFVLPNNGNIILAARQAASMYEKSDVRVLESRSIGDGYAALTMLNTDSGDTDAIVEELTFAMDGVVTAYVSKCSRDAVMDGFSLHEGQYIGFAGKDIISADNDRRDTAYMLTDKLDFLNHEVCILIRGLDSTPEEAEEISKHITASNRGCEVYIIEGGQDIYSYIVIVE